MPTNRGHYKVAVEKLEKLSQYHRELWTNINIYSPYKVIISTTLCHNLVGRVMTTILSIPILVLQQLPIIFCSMSSLSGLVITLGLYCTSFRFNCVSFQNSIVVLLNCFDMKYFCKMHTVPQFLFKCWNCRNLKIDQTF